MFTTKKPFVILHLGSILSETIPSENFIPHGNKHLAHILGNVTVYRHYAYLCHLIERGGFMRIGFIGAGKVGFTLGKYFSENNVIPVGYWSRDPKSAEAAAKFTNSMYYSDVEDLVRQSDTLFLTVPDNVIGEVWDGIKNFPLKDKIVCHTSGALSSGIFSDIDRTGAFGYSIHPIFAIHSKFDSYKELNKAFFTIEGSKDRLDEVCSFISMLGNSYAVIEKEKKALYHAAAVTASNHVNALLYTAKKYLRECGFTDDQTEKIIVPLFINNARSAAEYGSINALTGPVERRDMSTVKSHIDCLNGYDRLLYELLALRLCEMGELKNGNADYKYMKKYLRGDIKNETVGSDI